MKKAAYVTLTALPIVGDILRTAINPFWIHAGTDSFSLYSEAEQGKIRAFQREHPDEIITKRLLKEILK